MRVHVVNVMRGTPEIAGQTLDRFADFARNVEAKGFHGLWMTDSFGRGRATMDQDARGPAEPGSPGAGVSGGPGCHRCPG